MSAWRWTVSGVSGLLFTLATVPAQAEDFWVAEDKQRAAFERLDPVVFTDVGQGRSFAAFEKSVIASKSRTSR